MSEGWQVKTLGDVCLTIQDGAHESPQEQFDSPAEGRFLYITSKNIRTNYIDLANVSYVGGDFHNRIYPRCKPQVGDVLLTKDGANTGNVALNTIDEPFSLLSSVCLIKTQPALLEPAFLCYFLQSPEGLKSITGQMTGAAIKRIILRDIKLATIPTPSLAEQRRIVGILDEAFEGIATAKANAEKNLQNARALFESHLQSIFIKRGPRWTEKPLDAVSSILSGYSFKSTDFSSLGGSKCIKITNVGVGEFIADTGEYLPESFASEYARVLVKTGSIVIAMTRTIIAGGLKVAIVPFDYNESLLNQRVASIVPIDQYLNGRFLFSYLSTQEATAYVKSRVNTLMQPNLSITDLRAIPIPIPPRPEQDKLAEQIDNIRQETESLKSIYREKLATLDALKSSLLNQAFTGQL
jgi:type I restriction enzyme S subunit